MLMVSIAFHSHVSVNHSTIRGRQLIADVVVMCVYNSHGAEAAQCTLDIIMISLSHSRSPEQIDLSLDADSRAPGQVTRDELRLQLHTISG